MHVVYHSANNRGSFKLDWLTSKHSFSFGHFLDRNRMKFGKLRVLNDDIVSPGAGFETHPHQNMEIISIPLAGALSHQDSTGNAETIHTGEVQRMSAGTGITHSEFNPSQSEPVNFLQVWILPEELNIEPSYEQKAFSPTGRLNQWQLVISPDGENNSLTVNQQSWFSLLKIEPGQLLSYTLRKELNGVYFFNISAKVKIEKQWLGPRDAIGVWGCAEVALESETIGELLAIEVPMS